MSKYMLEMENINKSFGKNEVLSGVELNLKPGEVRALMGENGAGKSTLVKILGGIYSLETGSISIEGQKVSIKSVQDARKYGISFIHQEISNVPSMSIAENLFLGREPRTKLGLVDYKKMHEEARRALDVLDIQIDTKTKLSGLSIANQQMIEIARAISENAKIIIMDEPTASLSNKQVDHLFEQIEFLRKKNISIIYISHRMEETFTICDTVTVLRDGKFIGTKNVLETTENELISMMVGRDFENVITCNRCDSEEIVLEVKNLTNESVEDINFQLRKGEILGFSGLVGAGRTELAETLFGIKNYKEGQIIVKGKPVNIRSTKDSIDAGIVLVPEDRKHQGLFLRHDIKTNLTFQVLPEFISKCRVDTKREEEIVDEYKNKLSINMASLNQTTGELSGGNQQKIVISKWLAAQPSILILDEPTRGIDVGAKAEIYQLMNDLVKEGVSIIMISSELPEVINNSNRIAVMNEGRLVKILDACEEEITQEKIMSYAVGGIHKCQ